MPPREVPLRIDFAGGWLDVPALARPLGRIVNVAIAPKVTSDDLATGIYSGLGGSAARSILSGKGAVEAELAAGAGWQDPAVIAETGLCVWQSGPFPILLQKDTGEILRGRMAVLWTRPRDSGTGDLRQLPRDLEAIEAAGALAAKAVATSSLDRLCAAVERTYAAQLAEGMCPLPNAGELARKYCGSGHGGNAVYIFRYPEQRDAFVSRTPGSRAVESYLA